MRKRYIVRKQKIKTALGKQTVYRYMTKQIENILRYGTLNLMHNGDAMN